MSSDRAPPERPAPPADAQDDTIDAEHADTGGLSSITTAPGARRTDDTELLVIEADLARDGADLDNPAQPAGPETAAAFADRIEDTELEPAWLRPWEGDE